MRHKAALTVLFVVAAWSGRLIGEEDEVSKRIQELGHEKYVVREAATKWLWERGMEARAALEKAARDPDPEVASRARQVLGDLSCGIGPDTPADLARLLKPYRKSDADGQREILSQVWEEDAAGRECIVRLYAFEPSVVFRGEILTRMPEGWRRDLSLMVRLCAAEPDAAVKKEIISSIQVGSYQDATTLLSCYRTEKDAGVRKAAAAALAPAVRLVTTPLLLEGKVDEAERLLSDATAGGKDSALNDWAALVTLTGRLDAKIKEYEAPGAGADKSAAAQSDLPDVAEMLADEDLGFS
jgi:HEAT repeat protein